MRNNLCVCTHTHTHTHKNPREVDISILPPLGAFQLIAASPRALGEAMRLKPADTKQDMFVQALMTLERGSKMFSHVATARLTHL